MGCRIKYLYVWITLLFSPAILSAQIFNDGILRYRVLDREAETCEVMGPVANEIEGEMIIPEIAVYNSTSYKVISIRDRAFYGFSSLVSATLPESLQTIGNYAFYECSSLKDLSIPPCVSSLGYYVFSGTEISHIYIPESVLTIGKGSFSNCQDLKEIIVDDKNKRYKSVDGVLYTTQMDTLIQCPASFGEFTVPSSVKVIDEFAFEGCQKLESINFIGNLNKLGYGAFRACSALVSITIPEGVELIYDYTFSCCNSLSTINFPSTLKTVGAWSFDWCRSLKSLVLPESMQSLIIDAFYGTDLQSLTILADHYVGVNWQKDDYPSISQLYVKEHLLEEYKDSFWARYAKEILPIPMDEQGGSGVESISVDQDASFDIYNMNGMLIRRNAVKTDISGLNSGVYILKQGDASQRIMIR